MSKKALGGLVAGLALVATSCTPSPTGRAFGNSLLTHAAQEGISGQVNPYDRGGRGGDNNQLQFINLPDGSRGWINFQGYVIVPKSNNRFSVYTLAGENISSQVSLFQTMETLHERAHPYQYQITLKR